MSNLGRYDVTSVTSTYHARIVLCARSSEISFLRITLLNIKITVLGT